VLRAALWWSLSLQAVAGLRAQALPSAAARARALAPAWALAPVWSLEPVPVWARVQAWASALAAQHRHRHPIPRSTAEVANDAAQVSLSKLADAEPVPRMVQVMSDRLPVPACHPRR
jgi:hypothetical protein